MKKTIDISYEYFTSKEALVENDQKILNAALNIANGAQAPYSKFRVGASALLSDGRIISGFNIENAAYPQCLCAEQVMISNIKTQIKDAHVVKIALFSPDSKGTSPLSPCGSCRQILREQEFRQLSDIEVIMTNPTGNVWVFNSISDLLPLSFDSGNL